jgi:hypothetical protein
MAWLWVLLVIVVVGVLLGLAWWSSGRIPFDRERGEYRPGSDGQYRGPYGGGPMGGGQSGN